MPAHGLDDEGARNTDRLTDGYALGKIVKDISEDTVAEISREISSENSAGTPEGISGETPQKISGETSQEAWKEAGRDRPLRTLIDNFPNGAVVLFDTSLRFLVAGGQGLAEAGMPPHFLEGKTVWEAFTPAVAAVNEPLMRAALAGRASTDEVAYGDRIYELSVLPVRDDEGAVVAGMTLTQNITARKAAEKKQRFLAQATELLTSSLDYQTTLQSVAQLVVPHLADWCVVHLLNEAGILEMVTVAHADPARAEAAQESSRRYPPRMDQSSGVVGVARSGKSEWLADITDAMLRAGAQDEAHYDLLAASGMKSYLCVPLKARGRTLGTITFLGAESGHRYSEESLPLAEELARYAAIAVENARLFGRAQQEAAAREQAQNALRDSEKQLRLVMDAAPILISYIDTQQRYRFNNKAYADWLDQSPEQVNGKHVSQVIGEAAYQAVREQIEAALNGQEVVYEREMPYQGVTPRYVHSEFVPDRDAQGAVQGFVAVVSDITQAKRQQDALAESERRYRFMAESIPQILWTANADGGVDYYNQRWMKYTGLTLAQTSEWAWGACQHPDDIERTLNAWTRALQNGAEYAIEHRVRGADGKYHWFLTRGVAMRDADGSILKWFGTMTDIDEQKRAQARERLLGELGEQMRATNDPQEILWRAVCMVGEYLQTSRCYYTEINGEMTTIDRDYCRNVASWAGTYQRSDFGGEVIEELSRGRTVSITDTMTDPRTAAHYETTYAPVSIRAYLAVPLMEGGGQVATLVVSEADAPRTWNADEISLLETIAARTRMAVENARLWQAEREHSEQLERAIQEVHHRVKNSLQGASALLEMHIPSDSDVMPVAALREGLNQIKTIALVHDLLARDQPIGDVDAAQVLSKLGELLANGLRSARFPTAIRVQAEQVWIPTKAATSLALIVNELVSNAVKHNHKSNSDGFDARRDTNDAGSPALIEIELTLRDDFIHVSVQDGGPGFPANFDPLRSANIGLELVMTLARHDLHGTAAFSSRAEPDGRGGTGGGRVEIIFPRQVPSQ